jgi:hypothetical protein
MKRMVAYNSKTRFYRNPASRGTVAKYPLQSTENKPVKTIYKKRIAPTKPNMNKMAIMKLSKQVRTLQNQRLGEVQSHTLKTYLDRGNTELTDNLPSTQYPILFGLNNFYEQPIYKGRNNSGVATYAQVGHFTKIPYFSDLNDEFEWNAKRNQDVVSSAEYKPIFTRLNIKFQFANSLQTGTTKIRITLLKIKPYIASTKLNVNLPGALGAYRYLATGAGQSNANYFDKKLHTILVDKWINVKAPILSAVQTTFDKEVRIDYRYDSTILRPNITSSPSDQNWWTNTSTKDQIWCLISTNSEASMEHISISKFDVWRDSQTV